MIPGVGHGGRSPQERGVRREGGLLALTVCRDVPFRTLCTVPARDPPPRPPGGPPLPKVPARRRQVQCILWSPSVIGLLRLPHRNRWCPDGEHGHWIKCRVLQPPPPPPPPDPRYGLSWMPERFWMTIVDIWPRYGPEEEAQRRQSRVILTEPKGLALTGNPISGGACSALLDIKNDV